MHRLPSWQKHWVSTFVSLLFCKASYCTLAPVSAHGTFWCGHYVECRGYWRLLPFQRLFILHARRMAGTSNDSDKALFSSADAVVRIQEYWMLRRIMRSCQGRASESRIVLFASRGHRLVLCVSPQARKASCTSSKDSRTIRMGKTRS